MESISKRPRKFRSGTTLTKKNSNMGQTKDRVGCGITVPERKAKTHWNWPTNRLVNGISLESGKSVRELMSGLTKKHVVKHAIMENYWNRKLPLVADGPIQLQTHGGEIRWRNIYIREIDSKEANEILALHQDEVFEPIFNGQDFAGWQGPIKNYIAENGEIGCKPQSGGTIFTTEKYTDFVARPGIQASTWW